MTWIPEHLAAEMLQREPRTLRKKAKSRAWPITYTSIEGRGYQYSKNDLQKFLLKNSNKTN